MSTPVAAGKKTTSEAFRASVLASAFKKKPAKTFSTAKLDATLKRIYDPVIDQLKRLPLEPVSFPRGAKIASAKIFTRKEEPMKLFLSLSTGSVPIALACDLYEQRIIDFADSLKDRLLAKYRKGRREHGGSPVNVDCQAEVHQEVLDILNYFLIDKVNGNAKKA